MVERDRRVTLFFFQSALFPDGVHPAELVTLRQAQFDFVFPCHCSFFGFGPEPPILLGLE